MLRIMPPFMIDVVIESILEANKREKKQETRDFPVVEAYVAASHVSRAGES